MLDLLAVGLPTADVAALLRMSDATLRERIAVLLSHYRAEDRTTLVAAAHRRGEAPGLRRLAVSVALARTLGRPPG